MRLYGEWNYIGPRPSISRWLLPLFGLLICAVCARGDEPAFKATYTPAKTIPPTLRVEAPQRPTSPDDALYLWVISPQPSDLIATHEAATWTAEAGKAYSVTWVMKERGKPQQQRSGVVVAGDGKPPEPGPVDPPPVVVDAKFIIVVVENEGAPPASRGAYVNNTAILERCQEKGHTWRLVSDKSTAADVQRFIGKAKGKNLPQYFLVNTADGKTLATGDMPATPEAFLEAIKKAGG